jgi:hypothetical protein
MRYLLSVVLSAAVLMFSLSFGFCRNVYAGEMKHIHEDRSVMELNHMSTMMSHGLWMVTEGFDMVMLAGMKMAPSADPTTSEHGRQMIRSGKELIEHFMSGSQMKELHKTGHADTSLMKHTHELGEALMTVTLMLEKISAEGEMDAKTMTAHHMQLLISHALGMAAQGYNMAVLGQMSMSMPVDRFSIGEGQMMMTEARWLLKEQFEGKAMMDMRKKGAKMDNTMTAETHKLVDAATRVMDLLEKMPFAMGEKSALDMGQHSNNGVKPA